VSPAAAGPPPLAYELHVPDGAVDGAPVTVLLHGRGADRLDLLGLAPHLPAGTVLVTPEAPHAGAPWGYGGGWAWYRYVADDRVEPDTLATSLERLDDFLDGLPARLPVEPGPIVLGGFSQGGTTSLAWALTRPERVAGVAVLSGFLADAPGVIALPERGRVLEHTPVFWGHGTLDPAIPHALGERGRARLRELGVDLTARDYPTGHGLTGAELADLSDWIVATVRG
jgi:phospholipase/carboxylesterase